MRTFDLVDAYWKEKNIRKEKGRISGFEAAAAATLLIGGWAGIAGITATVLRRIGQEPSQLAIALGGANLLLILLGAVMSGALSTLIYHWIASRMPAGTRTLRRLAQIRRTGEASAVEVAGLLRAECDIRTLQQNSVEAQNAQETKDGRMITLEALRRTKVQQAVTSTLSLLLPDELMRQRFEQNLAAITSPHRDRIPDDGSGIECCTAHRYPALHIPHQRMQQLADDEAWQRLQQASRQVQGYFRFPHWENSSGCRLISQLLEAQWQGLDPRLSELACRMAENWRGSADELIETVNAAVA